MSERGANRWPLKRQLLVSVCYTCLHYFLAGRTTARIGEREREREREREEEREEDRKKKTKRERREGTISNRKK